MEKVLLEADELLKQENFIKNPWLGIFDSLNQWRRHLSRKQNQLYPVLEDHGFDRPTRIMWTFDDSVRDAISRSFGYLRDDQTEDFLATMPDTIDKIRDLYSKELEVLLPTAIKILSDAEFVRMSKGDHEIGFAIIAPPPLYTVDGVTGDEPTYATTAAAAQAQANANAGAVAANAGMPNEFLQDLAQLLGKYTGGSVGGSAPLDPKTTVLDVATGKLTLDQINLLFKHMPVDLSYVDENELVKFYSDTKHRIFPRSANVIGREVKNCHPAKSVHVVEEIIEKFRSGEQSQAEFWINKPEVFIYVLYTAIRDEDGNFKGVLEMMQDCTHIRSLEGSRTLLTWDGDTFVGESSKTTDTAASEQTEETSNDTEQKGEFKITSSTTLSELIKHSPDIVDYLITINPKFEMLKSPMVKVMSKVASLKMISERGDLNLNTLIKDVDAFINKRK